MRWWLSFCDRRRPVGEQFLGVTIVEGVDVVSAIKMAWARGLNPGGEVVSLPIDPEVAGRFSFDIAEYYDRFIPRDEAKALEARVSAEINS